MKLSLSNNIISDLTVVKLLIRVRREIEVHFHLRTLIQGI